MSAQQHMITTKYGVEAHGDLVETRLGDHSTVRSAQRGQIVSVALFILGCAVIAVQFIA